MRFLGEKLTDPVFPTTIAARFWVGVDDALKFFKKGSHLGLTLQARVRDNYFIELGIGLGLPNQKASDLIFKKILFFSSFLKNYALFVYIVSNKFLVYI
jgi:hypothetical protein